MQERTPRPVAFSDGYCVLKVFVICVGLCRAIPIGLPSDIGGSERGMSEEACRSRQLGANQSIACYEVRRSVETTYFSWALQGHPSPVRPVAPSGPTMRVTYGLRPYCPAFWPPAPLWEPEHHDDPPFCFTASPARGSVRIALRVRGYAATAGHSCRHHAGGG